MKITSAKFIKGVVGPDNMVEDELPQIAFIGRSNAGKSSLLNSLTNSSKLAITSKTPGRTREINVFLINQTHYFMDLPGYGYAKAGGDTIKKISELISWYLFESPHDPTVVVLVDANIGPTKDDLGIIHELEKAQKRVVVVLNKVDKIKPSQYQNQIKKLKQQLPGHQLFPYSSTKKIGIEELTKAILADADTDKL